MLYYVINFTIGFVNLNNNYIEIINVELINSNTKFVKLQEDFHFKKFDFQMNMQYYILSSKIYMKMVID